MARVLILGRAGSIDRDRVVAVVKAKSAPIIRLVKATDASRVIDMTYGYPRQSVIILDNGYIVISSRTHHEIGRAIGLCKEQSDEEIPPWWQHGDDI